MKEMLLSVLDILFSLIIVAMILIFPIALFKLIIWLIQL